MLNINLKQVQEAMPQHKVYAWRWAYYPELEVYRAFLWMELPFQGEDKVRFDRYIPVSLAPDVETVLALLSALVTTELDKGSKINGLKKL